MPLCMEIIYNKKSISKEFWLPRQTVWPESTCKIINNSFWWSRPSRYHSRENIIAAFTTRNAVKTVANTMRASSTHNASGQPPLAVLRIVFRALSTTVRHFGMTLISESWVPGAITYLWHTVTAPGLNIISYALS